jgi:MFS family permease
VSRRQLASSVRVMRAVLRSVALRRVMVAFLLYVSVQYATWVAVLLWAYHAVGPAGVGVVALLLLFPPGVFAAVAASVVDRYPAQRVLLGGYIATAALTGLAGVSMALDWAPVAVILVGAAAQCAMTMTRPAQGGLFPIISRTPEELTAANAISGSVDGLGMLLGPLVAAAILAAGPPAAVFGIAAVASLMASALVWKLRIVPADAGPAGAAAGASEPPQDAADAAGPLHRGPSVRQRLVAGARAMGQDADSRLVLGQLGAMRAVLGALDVLYVLLAMEVLGMGASGVGLLSAAVGLGFLSGGLGTFGLVGRRRLAPVLVAGAMLTGAMVILLSVASLPAVALVLVAVASLGAALIEVTGRTVLQRVVSGPALTRVLGALEGVELLAWGIGSIAAPVLVAAFGVTGAVAVVGVALPAAVLFSLVPLRRLDRRVRLPAREIALLREDGLLGLLPAPVLETVASSARWVTVEAGGILIQEGDEGDRYFVLESGGMRITQGGRVLGEADHRGYGLGEIALLRSVRRTATATATAASVLLAVERDDFLQAVTGHEQARAVAQDTADARDGASLALA